MSNSTRPSLSAPRTHNSLRSRRSLAGEWTRACAILVLLLLVTACLSILGVRGLLNQVQATAHKLHDQTVMISALGNELEAHEEAAHKLLSDEPIDRSAYLAQQQDIIAKFAQAVAAFPVRGGLRGTVLAAERSWEQGLMQYSLWGNQIQTLVGSHESENPTFGAASDTTDSLLASVNGPSLDEMNRGLAHADDLENILVAGLVVLFAISIGATAYFRRWMLKDLIGPVVNIHEGVERLRAGEYAHRIAVRRRDELGELTDAFNDMAETLHDNHLALTMRATHDSLTGLPNRASLIDRLTASFAPGAERRALHESVLFIDVDDFKNVNDSLGHEGGDELLIQLAGRLRECTRPQDLVARLGGDEFAIVLLNTDNEGMADKAVADRILGALRSPFTVNGVSLVVSVSIGAAHRRADTTDVSELLRGADFAMYMAKSSGKDRFQLFDTSVHDEMVGRTAFRAELASAAVAGQLRLDYQPVVMLTTGRILGAEALVRWQHPSRGLLAPAEFIPMAEETGAITSIGLWVLQTALRQAANWRQEIAHCGELTIWVNLSPFQLRDQEHLGALDRILADPASEAKGLILELTETALTANIEGATDALSSLRGRGAKIAIDDFGSGFSSLGALARLPLDILKIDRALVSGPAASGPMLESILGLAEKLSLRVVAEGIEQAEQLDLLRGMDCPLGQGYYLAKPMPAVRMHALLAANSPIALSHFRPIPAHVDR